MSTTLTLAKYPWYSQTINQNHGLEIKEENQICATYEYDHRLKNQKPHDQPT